MEHQYLIIILIILVAVGGISYYYSLEPAEVEAPEQEPAEQEQFSPTPPEITPPETKIAYVEIKDFKFVPNELTVSAGTTVVWINNDWAGTYGRQHMVVGHYNKFRSQKLAYGDKFNFTFTEPGRYTYIEPLYKYSGNITGLKTTTAAIIVEEAGLPAITGNVVGFSINPADIVTLLLFVALGLMLIHSFGNNKEHL